MGRHSRHVQPAAPQPGPRGHRGGRKHHPVRTGLLASSAAMAVGAVAASSGLLSAVTGSLPYQDGDGASTQADAPGPTVPGSDIPSPLSDGATPDAGGGTILTPGSGTAGSPGSAKATPRPSASPTRTKAAPSATAPTPTRTTAAPTTPVVTVSPAPPARTTPANAPAATDAVTAARAQILALVNEQRATAGCKPVTENSALDQLAQNFSDDMAARGFFDHTDPDGNTPGTGPRSSASPTSAARTSPAARPTRRPSWTRG